MLLFDLLIGWENGITMWDLDHDFNYEKSWLSLVAQRVKRLPAMQETRVRSLGREDPLEKEMATHSSILAWKIPWTEEPGRLYSPWGHKESDTTEQLTHIVINQ